MKSVVRTLLAGLITAFCSLVSYQADAQSASEKVYTVAEVQPEFPGGYTALSRYLAETIKVPGSMVRKHYDTGPIAAKFIINDIGYVQDVRITMKPLDKKTLRGVQAYITNIIAAIEKMPRWQPGLVGGKAVPVFYTLPIEITMQ
ncbi:energy transducer TonB [Spirosoma pulveris]